MSRIGEPQGVGWYSWDEWSYTRSLLYSLNNPARLEEGVAMVKCWRSRLRGGGLPVSIDVTSALVSAYLVCLNGEEYQARLAASMAIVRFINGITDLHQTGIYVSTVQNLADKVDIPDWMVDLRHEATHTSLPGFDTLKGGLTFALKWLDKHYWEETSLTTIEKERTFTTCVNEILANYVNSMFHMVDLGNLPGKKKKILRQELIAEQYEFSRHLCRTLHVGNLIKFLDTFTQDGFFIPDSKQIQSLGISLTNNILNEASLGKLAAFGKHWKVLFSIVCGKFPSFIEMLTKKVVNKRDRYYDRYLDGLTYSRYLLSIYVIFQYHNKPDEIILTHLLRNPSHIGFQLLEIIIKECSYDLRSKILRHMAIFKPVMYFLMRKTSATLDMKVLDYMGQQASEKAKEMLAIVKKNVSERESQPPEDYPRFAMEEELSVLPPMGEFDSHEKIFLLDLRKNRAHVYCEPNKYCDSFGNFLESKEVTESDLFKSTIDNLFLDDAIPVSDEVTSSSATGQYDCEHDEAWDEATDVCVDVKSAIDIKHIGSAFHCQLKDWTRYDPTRTTHL